jgi:hypothetical protein
VENNFYIEYRGFLSNHLAHGAIALYFLGKGLININHKYKHDCQ